MSRALAVALACGLAIQAAPAQVREIQRLTARPLLYDRVDFQVTVTADWARSPFVSEEVALDFHLQKPSGGVVVVPAFYDSGPSGGPSVWRVRFAPAEAGLYRGRGVLVNHGRTNALAVPAFEVAPSDNKGFLRPGSAWTFRFDNGAPFRGLGENIGWESRNNDDSKYFRKLHEDPRFNYEYLLSRLSTNGGNFFRTWMCPWNLPLEWKSVTDTARYRDDPGYFNASAIRRMDQLVELAGSLDVYIMLTLDSAGNFMGGAWDRSSYRKANGGPAAEAREFFTDPAARAQYRDRLRYLVARWGYSPHIAAWEFFNEIDNLMYGLSPRIPDDVITAWHTEMSDYLKRVDPYQHLVTTSVSHREVAGLYDLPSIDFNQRHIYGHDGQSRVDGFPGALKAAGHARPLVIGEFGFEWDWSRNFNEFAPQMDRDFRRGLWLGLFSPTPVLPMSWWWEYFDERGTISEMRGVRKVLDWMLAAGGGSFESIDAAWSGPAVRVLGVRCGRTLFFLVLNDASEPALGNLSWKSAPGGRHSALNLDGGLTQTNRLVLPAGASRVEGVRVPAGGESLVVIVPE
ncbi:MAG: DUF5060 domain-containing protein [Verrucomicrobiota bacterium]